jgi:hypothetical protein
MGAALGDRSDSDVRGAGRWYCQAGSPRPFCVANKARWNERRRRRFSLAVVADELLRRWVSLRPHVARPVTLDALLVVRDGILAESGALAATVFGVAGVLTGNENEQKEQRSGQKRSHCSPRAERRHHLVSSRPSLTGAPLALCPWICDPGRSLLASRHGICQGSAAERAPGGETASAGQIPS